MPTMPVNFEYRTGLRRSFLVSARLSGTWNAQGLRSEQWSSAVPMEAFTGEDGCPTFRATAQIDDSQIGQTFNWGVTVSTAERADVWGIVAEVNSATSTERYRSFTLQRGGQTERYFLTHCRRLGANKLRRDGQPDAIRFGCWAPNAQAVDVVIGGRDSGYIWNDGRGVTATYPMHRGDDGVWETQVADAPAPCQPNPFFCDTS